MRLLLPLLLLPCFLSAQTWVDSLDQYAREEFLPAKKYQWVWQQAPLLKAHTQQYHLRPKSEKAKYLGYVRTAMNHAKPSPKIRWPNGVASGIGMAFLMKISGDKRYKKVCERIFKQYLKIRKIENGAVSHVPFADELWDDTIYMIGVFLMEMYKTTGEEQYIEELVSQIRLHREKLIDKDWGLWVHGWDANDKTRMTICGNRDWQDPETRRSPEIWGRGTGWIVVVMSDLIKVLPNDHPLQMEIRSYLKEMVVRLPELQDPKTGHWRQLPVKPKLAGNFIESSSTAMFAYGILTALQEKVIEGKAYEESIRKAYHGLRAHSLYPVENGWLNTKNVCKGTCIGDEAYYLNRKVTSGKAYAVGMFISFGLHYEYEMGIR